MINTIIQGFDIWSEAQGVKSKGRVKSIDNISLEGISRLRDLILDLAIQGKLMPQNHEDEPANLLLQRIFEEKERLIVKGELKKQKPLPKIKQDELPFSLPENWIWSRLGNLGIGSTGKTPKTTVLEYFGGDIPFIGPGQIDNTGIIGIPDKFLTELGSEYSTIANIGDIIMVCIGGSIGKSAIVNQKITFNQQLNAIRPIYLVSKYLNLAMNSSVFQELLIEKSTGSATPIINRAKWENLLIPLPPVEEQKIIVAKVDELMALCDKLEEEQTNNLKTHQTLVKTLLETLTQAKDANELQIAWKRMEANFDVLFCTEDSIEQLKQTILQLAVMGKLVKQDPDDEPACILLEKIEKEKEKLIEEGKITKQKPLPKITKEDKTFNLPNGWEWVRPDDFSVKITDGEHFRPETQENGIYFLSAKDIKADGVSLEDPLFISEKTAEVALQRCNPEKGDILIVSRGATVGRMCTVDIDETFCLLGSVILIKPISLISSEFLKIVMKSQMVLDKLISASGATAQQAIYLRDLKKIVFPIAPISEQHRIVKKVNELFSICDALNECVIKSQVIINNLSKAIVEKAVQ